MKTAREIAEMVNHGNDVAGYERYIEYCTLAASSAFDECNTELDRLRTAGKKYADWIDEIYSSLPADCPPGPPRRLLREMRSDFCIAIYATPESDALQKEYEKDVEENGKGGWDE